MVQSLRSQGLWFQGIGFRGLLGGYGVVISIVTLLITLLRTTHEPPSRTWGLRTYKCAGVGARCLLLEELLERRSE